MADERLIEDPLFLACTRPAMVMGVPMEAVGVNVILSGIVFLVGGSLLYLLVAPALHLVFRAICKADHNAFRLLFVYVDTKGRARNGATWGGSSPTPLPLVRRLTAGGLRHG
ncbi:MAG: type IV secretion system protein VirB3 [Brevundimonas sp.]|jgi:type IV secretion system protein VirB3|uniref:type IV secretion system protein VirB3 n=1 Tax=Brevundimonas sp. TaxID=1871086 RepID=UPI003919D9CE